MLTKLLATTAALGLAAGLTFIATGAAAPTPKAEIGQPAPDFTLMDQDNQPVDLSEHKGKIVVLEWFNDQCPFVVKHYKNGDMNELAAKYADKGVVWLAVDSSNFSDVSENAQIAQEWGIDRPLLDDSAGGVGKMYDAKTTPHMYIIDADGNLAYAGAIDSIRSTDPADVAKADNYVAKALDELLAGESVSTPETKAYGCSVKF
jgi:peroxiredoxin